MDVTLRGSDDVDALVRRIRMHANAKALRKELYAGLNRVTKPVREDMKASIGPSLPSRGGLASLVEKRTKFRTSARGGRDAGVRIFARHPSYDLKGMNAGRIRHPVFASDRGRKRGGTALSSERSSWTWVEQTAGVNPGFLDDSFEKQKPEIARGILRVLDEIARKVEG